MYFSFIPGEPIELDDRQWRKLGLENRLLLEESIRKVWPPRRNPARVRKNYAIPEIPGDITQAEDYADGTSAVTMRRYGPRSPRWFGMY
jgi:hypothetical protein